MTLVLDTGKLAQLLPVLLFAHKLRSRWCLLTNLTLQNILFFLKPLPREFSDVNASVPRCSALKRVIISLTPEILS